jgi:hypothetical protein
MGGPPLGPQADSSAFGPMNVFREALWDVSAR